MKLSEAQLEDLIYENIWLLDERFSIAKIKGAKVFGRQVNVGRDSNRHIDILCKDDRDNRPVIVELKIDSIKRNHIAQLLEYRALLISLEEEYKDEWQKEFGSNYFIPKLFLVGKKGDVQSEISASLAGIQIKYIDGAKLENLGYNTFTSLKSRLDEWNAIRNSGNSTLINREPFINKWQDLVNEVVESKNSRSKEDLFEIAPTPPKLYNHSKYYIAYQFPFINIKVTNILHDIMGIFEYLDEDFPFDEKYVYVDFPELFKTNIEKEEKLKISSEMKKFSLPGLHIFNPKNYDWPSYKLERSLLLEEKDFKKTIMQLLNYSNDLLNKYARDVI